MVTVSFFTLNIDVANSAGIRQIVDEYEALLTQHIEKENTVLFPMADSKLDPGTANHPDIKVPAVSGSLGRR